jgi:glycosyltransferase involved in cell wall biosynthesis
MNGVPASRITLHAPRAHRHALFVFVLNEGARLLRQLEKMRNWTQQIDLYIADGGSTDGSLDPETLAALGVRGVLVKTGPGALSAQMRMAFAWALGEGYEGVVVMDGNDKDDPEAVPRFIQALDAGFDHVQGSRYVPGGRGVNTPFLRRWGGRLIHAPLLSLAAGFRYTDTTNGFRAYSAAFLRDARVAPLRDVFLRYELHYYLAIRAARLGFRVMEIPVTRTYPAGGPLPSKIRGFRGNLSILGTLVRACLGHYDPLPPR